MKHLILILFCLIAIVPNELYQKDPEAVIQTLGVKFVETHDCKSGKAEVSRQRTELFTVIEIRCKEVGFEIQADSGV
jgi:hypothetical protein